MDIERKVDHIKDVDRVIMHDEEEMVITNQWPIWWWRSSRKTAAGTNYGDEVRSHRQEDQQHNDYVSIRELSYGHQGIQTGGRVWHSGVLLSQWFVEQLQLLQDVGANATVPSASCQFDHDGIATEQGTGELSSSSSTRLPYPLFRQVFLHNQQRISKQHPQILRIMDVVQVMLDYK